MTLEESIAALQRYFRTPRGQHRSEWAIIDWSMGRPRVLHYEVEKVCADLGVLASVLQAAAGMKNGGLDFLSEARGD